MKKYDPIGSSWEDFPKEVFTPEEIAEGKAEAARLMALIEARDAGEITQKQLEELTGAGSEL